MRLIRRRSAHLTVRLNDFKERMVLTFVAADMGATITRPLPSCERCLGAATSAAGVPAATQPGRLHAR